MRLQLEMTYFVTPKNAPRGVSVTYAAVTSATSTYWASSLRSDSS